MSRMNTFWEAILNVFSSRSAEQSSPSTTKQTQYHEMAANDVESNKTMALTHGMHDASRAEAYLPSCGDSTSAIKGVYCEIVIQR